MMKLQSIEKGNIIMNSKPLVTVLIPVYNRPDIVKAIESVINQTYDNLEILIMDNASTDETVDAIKAIKDDRIRLVINEVNLGQTGSMNRGLDLAKGKYIARLDSDDIALPTRIEKQVQFMEEHPDYALCGSWVQGIDEEDRLQFVVNTPTTDKGLRFIQTLFCGMYHPTAMMRTATLRANKIYYNKNIKIAEDYDMWGRILKFGKGLNLGEVLVYYRRSSQNDSRIHADIARKEAKDIRIRNIINDVKNESLRNDLLKEIDLEEKEKKSLLEAIKIKSILMEYFHKTFDKDDPDYNVIRSNVIRKIISVCILENQAIYGRLLTAIYRLLYSMAFMVGKRAR